jgi:hypothetical protein
LVLAHNGPAFTLAGGKNTKVPELTKPGKRRMVLTAARPAGRKGFVMPRNNQSVAKVPQNRIVQPAASLAHA